MALDHYVPQVHLRRFLSPTGLRLNAFRRSDCIAFSPRTQDVCRIDEGSTNPWLQEPRVIEEFLKTVEPRYNAAIDALRSGSSDETAIQVVAGFAAYVAICSPAAMRMFSEPLRRSVEAIAALMDARGVLPPAPATLGGVSLSDLIRQRVVEISVDPKYPQSLGIREIHRHAAAWA